VAEHGRSAALAAAAQRLHLEVQRLEGRHTGAAIVTGRGARS
jgi:uncharacterized lipoprotein YmbA